MSGELLFMEFGNTTRGIRHKSSKSRQRLPSSLLHDLNNYLLFLLLQCSRKDGPPVCAFCSGEHETRQCDHKRRNDMTKMMCVNCNGSSSREDKRHSKSHLASSTLCPFYVNERTKLMERTSGVTKESKNMYRTRAMEELRLRRSGGLVR